MRVLIEGIDVAAASEETREELDRLVPMHADLEPAAKVHMLQSVVSRILVETIFDSYFFGLPKEQADQFKAVEETLSSYGCPPNSFPLPLQETDQKQSSPQKR